MASRSVSKKQKKCKRCGKARLLTLYDRAPTSNDGFAGVCKPCRNARAKAIHRLKKEGKWISMPRGKNRKRGVNVFEANTAAARGREQLTVTVARNNSTKNAPLAEKIALTLVPLVSEAIEQGVKERIRELLNGAL